MEKTKKFIQKIIEHEKRFEHVGYTHDLLSIPRDYNLSRAETLMEKIVKAPIDTVINNPLKIGNRQYKVTKEMKQHVNAALNLIRISESYHIKKRREKAKRK